MIYLTVEQKWKHTLLFVIITMQNTNMIYSNASVENCTGKRIEIGDLFDGGAEMEEAICRSATVTSGTVEIIFCIIRIFMKMKMMTMMMVMARMMMMMFSTDGEQCNSNRGRSSLLG